VHRFSALTQVLLEFAWCADPMVQHRIIDVQAQDRRAIGRPAMPDFLDPQDRQARLSREATPGGLQERGLIARQVRPVSLCKLSCRRSSAAACSGVSVSARDIVALSITSRSIAVPSPFYRGCAHERSRCACRRHRISMVRQPHSVVFEFLGTPCRGGDLLRLDVHQFAGSTICILIDSPPSLDRRTASPSMRSAPGSGVSCANAALRSQPRKTAFTGALQRSAGEIRPALPPTGPCLSE
jgi:hypothetical protein